MAFAPFPGAVPGAGAAFVRPFVRKTDMRCHPAAALVVLALAGSAIAQPIQESEPNNTMATANFVAASQYPTGAFAFDGSITPGDVDWLSVTLGGTDPWVIDAAIFGHPNSLTGDSQLILVGTGGSIIAADDDNGVGLFSALQATVTPGTYFLGITGFDDLGFGTPTIHLPTGDHDETFNYKLLVGFNPVPAPGSIALFGAGGLLALRRRRHH